MEVIISNENTFTRVLIRKLKIYISKGEKNG
jgi:hypothetical protein